MASFILRDIDKDDPGLWAAVKAKAAKDGHPLRWLLLSLLREWLKEK